MFSQNHLVQYCICIYIAKLSPSFSFSWADMVFNFNLHYPPPRKVSKWPNIARLHNSTKNRAHILAEISISLKSYNDLKLIQPIQPGYALPNSEKAR